MDITAARQAMQKSGIEVQGTMGVGHGLQALLVPGKDGVEAWRALRRELGGQKIYPLIIGNPEETEWIHEQLHADFGEEELAEEPDPIALLETMGGDEEAAEGEEDEAEMEEPNAFDFLRSQKDLFNEIMPGVDVDSMLSQLESEMPELGGELSGLLQHQDAEGELPSYSCMANILTGEYLDKVAILLLPASDQAEALKMLRFGGWNDCPFPGEHATIARYWNSKYGAELAAMTDGTLEYAVANPPQDIDEAKKLAKEQYQFCRDIVEQGTGSKSLLASTLLKSRMWFFWWD